jgi:hypothetical protein
MISSFILAVTFFVLDRYGHSVQFAYQVLFTAGFTTVCWVPFAFLGTPTSEEQLIAFYRKVHPAGPGWTRIRKLADITEAEAALHGDHMGVATIGWISGCAVIWSSLFAIGNFLYGRMQFAWELTGVFVVSGVTLLWVVNHLWDKSPVEEPVAV